MMSDPKQREDSGLGVLSSRPFTVRLPNDVLRRLRDEAVRQGARQNRRVAPGALIRTILDQHLPD